MHFKRLFALAMILIACAGRRGEAQSATLFTNNTMDNEFVWFEKGVYPGNGLIGLPHAGLITGWTDPQSTFFLQPYTSNNVLLVQPPSNPPAVPGVQSGTMTLVKPMLATSLAIATSSGFGPVVLQVTVHFADGYRDEVGSITSPNWGDFRTPVATFAAGRFRVNNPDGTFANRSISNSADFEVLPGMDPHGGASVNEIVFAMTTDGAHPVRAVDFQFVSSSSPDITPYHKAAIFGISTGLSSTGPFTAVELTPSSFNADVVIEAPEPGTVGLLCVVATALLRRGRRRLRQASGGATGRCSVVMCRQIGSNGYSVPSGYVPS